jgi:hypothetical protein
MTHRVGEGRYLLDPPAQGVSFKSLGHTVQGHSLLEHTMPRLWALPWRWFPVLT